MLAPELVFEPDDTLLFFDEIQQDLRANRNLGAYKSPSLTQVYI